jgi:hypothetical protein
MPQFKEISLTPRTRFSKKPIKTQILILLKPVNTGSNASLNGIPRIEDEGSKNRLRLEDDF